MKKDKKITYKKKTREDLADPHNKIPYEQRLEMAGAIDLKDNHTIEDLGNGYIKVNPIDTGKKIKAKRPTGPIKDIKEQDYWPKAQGDAYQVHFDVLGNFITFWNESSGIQIPKESFIEFVNKIIQDNGIGSNS